MESAKHGDTKMNLMWWSCDVRDIQIRNYTFSENTWLTDVVPKESISLDWIIGALAEPEAINNKMPSRKSSRNHNDYGSSLSHR